jgi:hypothetical protein
MSLFYFDRHAQEIFDFLITDFGYVYTGERYHPTAVTFIYQNDVKRLKIEITNAPTYTDYGFSFFIFDLNTGQHNILHNISAQWQDDQGRYLVKAKDDLFSSEKALDLISGKYWENLSYILFQK